VAQQLFACGALGYHIGTDAASGSADTGNLFFRLFRCGLI